MSARTLKESIAQFRAKLTITIEECRDYLKLETKDDEPTWFKFCLKRHFLPLKRVNRILHQLEYIASWEIDDSDDVAHLITISEFTSSLCIYHTHESPWIKNMNGGILNPDFVTKINAYQSAAHALNQKFGHPYKQLTGEIMQYIGVMLLTSITIMPFTLAVTVPILSLVCASAMTSIGVGAYLSKHNLFSQLKADVDKNINSSLCNPHHIRNTDPDASYVNNGYARLLHYLY